MNLTYERRFLRTPNSLSILSLDYFIALLPVIVWSTLANGPRVICLCIVGAFFSVIFESVIELLLRKRITAWDGSAAIEGLVFTLLLPPTVSYLFVIVGTLFSAIVFKALFGGQGKLPIYPAVGAYALLYPFIAKSVTYAAHGEILPILQNSPIGSVRSTMLDSLANGGVPSTEVISDFVAGNLAKESPMAVARKAVPFIIAFLTALVLITYIPWFSLALV